MIIFGIKAQITKCIDDEGYPSFVECEFIDAHGRTHIFQGKDVYFEGKWLDRNNVYPTEGIINCEIAERKNVNGREIVKINTIVKNNSDEPWGVESINDETVFEVFPEQLVESEYTPRSTEGDFIPFGDYMVAFFIFDAHLRNLYDAFNRREIEAVLSMMDENVKWANGMEGGFVCGRDAVREYWRRQFEQIDPQLEPLKFKVDKDMRYVVTVRQIVRDLDGKVLLDKAVKQIFTIKDGLIKTFEIAEA